MTQEQIVEGNKPIAEFMGFTHWIDSGEWIGYCKLDVDKYSAYKDGMGHRPHACLFEDLRFHSSYDWLMPVIGKISENCEEPEELDSLKYALLCDDINTAWSFVVDYLSN